jgi:hypothetical protein
MSFLRHGEIYRPMVAGKTPERPGCDRPGLIGTMSFRLAIPGGLPSGSARFRFTSHAQNALQWSCRSRIFQRTVNSVLFDCLSAGVHPIMFRIYLGQDRRPASVRPQRIVFVLCPVHQIIASGKSNPSSFVQPLH